MPPYRHAIAHRIQQRSHGKVLINRPPIGYIWWELGRWVVGYTLQWDRRFEGTPFVPQWKHNR